MISLDIHNIIIVEMSKKQSIEFREAIPRTSSDISELLSSFEEVTPSEHTQHILQRQNITKHQQSMSSPIFKKPIHPIIKFAVSGRLIGLLRDPEISGTHITDGEIEKIHKILCFMFKRHNIPSGYERYVLYLHLMFAQIENIDSLECFQKKSGYSKISHFHDILNSINVHSIEKRINALNSQSSQSEVSEDCQFIDLTLQIVEESDIIHMQSNILSISKQYICYSLDAKGYKDPHFSAFLISKIKGLPLLRYFFYSKHDTKIQHLDIQWAYGVQFIQIFNETDFFFEDYSSWYQQQISSLLNNKFSIQDVRDKVMNRINNYWVEKLLIGLLGWNDEMATEATVLLNVLYDGVDWQREAPFNPIISQVDEKFMINYLIDGKQNRQYLNICLKAPCMDSIFEEDVFSWHSPDIKQFKSDDDRYLAVHMELGEFKTSGFYDWKLFQLTKEGRNNSVNKIVSNKNKPHVMDKKIHDVRPVQGRFIVHPRDTRKLQIHEVYMDSLTVNENSHKIPQFQDAFQDVKKYKEYGINSIYLMGVFQRDTGKFEGGYKRPQASPMALTNRKKPCEMFGGENGFEKLMKNSREIGMKMITDCTSRISSSRFSKAYQPFFLHYIDESGKKQHFYGAEGRSISYEETSNLNYRQIECWNLMIEEIKAVIENYGISGIYLDNGSSWPNIFEINWEQMLRTEDGERYYSEQQIFEGIVVNKNKIAGYWSSKSCSEYPNPLFVKIVRSIWAKHPDFHIICESFQKVDKDDKNIIAIISGLIPRTFRLPKAISQIVGFNLDENGTISNISPKNILTFKRWYEQIQKHLPRNSIIIQSTSSHAWPYPAFLFKKATWAFVDLLFMLPEIPMTFIGEHDGKAYRSKATSIFFENHQNKSTQNKKNSIKKTNSSFFNSEIQGNSSTQKLNISVNPTIRDPSQIQYLEESFRREVGPEYGFDLKQIHKHYSHRRKMRHQIPLLTNGKMISLSAEHKYGLHKNVLSFAKYNEKQILLISINFNETDIDMHYNLNNLKYLFTKAYRSNLVVKLESVMGVTIPESYYIISELLYSRVEAHLKAYQSMIWKITVQKNASPQIAYNTSIKRMQQSLLSNPPQWIYSSVFTNQISFMLDHCKSLKSFVKNLSHLYEKFILPQNLNFSLVVSKTHQFWLNKNKLSKLFGIFKLIDTFPNFNETLKQSIKTMIEGNKLGPIAFVTPEIGVWSTVGGLGVMVDELSKQLVKLGEQVYIVSPYYQYNKKGECDYLPSYGFQYDRNIKVWSAHISHQFGVHTGKYKGVNFIWLHNPELFSKPYAGQSAYYVTQQLVFFALATSQTFCQIKVFPSIIVTNDWMCGFVSGYPKVGRFGSVFNGAKFMHICHNLDPLYEGRLYPKHEESNLNWLIQLPPEWYIEYRSNKTVINPSKCALETCDNWGTVSNSYKFDLLKDSPLSYVLWKHQNPFAFPNGVRKQQRVSLLHSKTPGTHAQSKELLRNKYFKGAHADSSVPILSFIGRITKQKGVHLILESVEAILHEYNYKVQFIVGGPADAKQQYGKYCADRMLYLNNRYSQCFWSDPNSFFYDGPLCNIGSDYALMPSLFEPGGIVQHQFFCGSTPVIAFRTGGLKDTVFQYEPKTNKGNGFNFMSYQLEDFKNCLRRAINLFKGNREAYEKLRANAFDSVVEEEDVAKGWNTQFYRLQDKIYIDWLSVEKEIEALKEKDFEDHEVSINEIGEKGEFWNEEWEIKKDFKAVLQSCQKLKAKEVTFTYETEKIPRPKDVCVSGSWDDWKTQKKMTYQPVKKNWKIVLKVGPGTYYYKYVVDNQWMLNKKQQIETDINNIENHVVVVQ